MDSDQALAVVRDTLTRYIDAPLEAMQLDTTLADLSVDSLTVAELMFELEDRLGVTLSETTAVPQTLRDVVALILPLANGPQAD